MMTVTAITVGVTVTTACDRHDDSNRTCQAALIMDMAAHTDKTLDEAADHVVAQVREQLAEMLTHRHPCPVEVRMS